MEPEEKKRRRVLSPSPPNSLPNHAKDHFLREKRKIQETELSFLSLKS